MVNIRFALRTLFKTPFVSISAITSIALGIGANTAIFSIFEQVLLRDLPVQEPGRLVNFSAPGPRVGSTSASTQVGSRDDVFSYPMFRDLERAQRVFSGIAAHRQFRANLATRGTTWNAKGVLVSGSYFSVLGVRPALGRLLGPDDDRVIGESHVVVLSYDYWETRFGRDPSVLNQALVVNGQSLTIVGIAQRGFSGTTVGVKPQVFVPITLRPVMSSSEPAAVEDRHHYWVFLFARLKPGVTLEQARSALGSQFHAIMNEVEVPLQKGMSGPMLAQFKATPLILEPGSRGQNTLSKGNARTWLSILLGITGLVLIIACANVANLLLARGTARAAEISLRLSLGASRAQVVGQLFAESCLLALLAGSAGILVAQWTLDLIVLLFPAEGIPGIPLSLNLPALLFAAALALATSMIFGLYPAVHSTHPDLVLPLKRQAGQLTGMASTSRFRNALAAAQITLSLALLILAGLFAKSLLNVNREDLGMRIDTVATFRISPLLNGYSQQRSFQLFERLENELAALPGVNGVTSSSITLLNRDIDESSVIVEGYKAKPDTVASSLFHKIGPAYFGTLGIPMIAGRDFSRSDTSGSRKVAVINEAFARKFDLGRNAIGKYMGTGPNLDMEIVGLVQNSKYGEVRETAQPIFYYPYRQDSEIRYLTFYVRTPANPEPLIPRIRQLMARLDPNLPLENLVAMPQQVSENISADRAISILSAAFACLATLLAAVGLYGMLAYTVAQRTREIGLRMALGATQSQVREMVLRQVGAITIIGGVIGLSLGMAFGHIAQSMLFQLKGSDPAVFCGSAIALTFIALVSGFIPAYRASKIDPMQALRYQ